MQQLTGIAIYPRDSTEATLWQSESPFTNFLLGSGKSGFIVGNTSNYNCPDYTTLGDLFYSVGRIQRKVEIFDSVTLENKALAGVGGLSKTSDVEFSLINLNKDIKPFKLFGRKVVIYLCQNTYNRLDLETVKLLQPNDENSIIKYTGIITNIAPSKGVLTFTVKSNFSLLDREIGEFLETETEKYINQIIPIVYGDFSDDSAYIPVLLKTKENDLSQLVVESQALYNLYNLKIYDSVYDEAIYAQTLLDGDLDLNETKTSINLIDKSERRFLMENVDSVETLINIHNPYTFYAEFDDDLSTLTAKTAFSPGTVYFCSITEGIDTHTEYYEYLGNNIFSLCEINLESSAAGGYFRKWELSSGTGPMVLICRRHGKARPKLFDLKQYYREDPTKTDTVFIKINDEIIRLVAQIGPEELGAGSSGSYHYTTYRVIRHTSSTEATSHTYGDIIFGSNNVEKENKLVFEHTFWPYAVGNLSSSKTDPYGNGNYLEILSVAEFPIWGSALAVQELAKKGLGRVVDVNSNGERCDLSIDLMFKVPNIKGIIDNVWLQGYYEVISLSSPFAYITLGVGGIPFWSSYSLDHMAYLGTQPENVVIPEMYFGSASSVQVGVGSRLITKRTPHDGNADDSIGIFSPIVYLTDSDWWTYFVISAFVDGVLDTNYSAPLYNSPRLEGSYLCRKFNSFGVLIDAAKHFSLKCEEQEDFPYAMGISGAEDLDAFFERRYWLYFYVPRTATFKISNPGFLVRFKTNIAEEQLYIEAKGRINSGETLIENPVEILTDFIEKEINEKASGESLVVDSVSTTSAIAIKDYKSTLLLTGDRQQASKILDSFCKENGLIVAENSEGEVTVDSLNFPESSSGLLNLTEDNFVLSNNYIDFTEKYTSIENLFTDLEVFYQKNFAVSKASTTVTEKEENKVYAYYYQDDMNENAFSILGVNKKRTFESNYFRDTTSVLTAVNLIKSYYTLPFRILTIAVNITTEIRIGQWIIWTGDSAEMLGINTSYLLVLGYDEQLPSGGEKPELRITVLEVTSELVAIIGEDIIEEMLALPNPELGEFEEVMDSPDEEEPKEIEEVK